MDDNSKYEVKARAVAVALGGTMRQPYESGNAYYYITLPDGVRFAIKFGGWAMKGRVSVSTAYPQAMRNKDGDMRGVVQRDFDRDFKYNDSPFDGITVADTKTPEQIAKDIQRRFLPEYSALYAKAVQYAADQVQYFTELAACTEAIKVALFDSGIRATYFGRDYATLEISAGPALARVIADAVRKFKASA